MKRLGITGVECVWHLALIALMKIQTDNYIICCTIRLVWIIWTFLHSNINFIYDNYIIYNVVLLDYYELFELFTHVTLICIQLFIFHKKSTLAPTQAWEIIANIMSIDGT